MSADNGIYVLQTKDGFRVQHAQAIENIYWWHTCCDNPDVVEKEPEGIEYIEICRNCGTEKPDGEMRYESPNPIMLREIFGDCKVFKTQEEAYKEATRIYNEIIHSDFPIIEYGIQLINYEGELNE